MFAVEFNRMDSDTADGSGLDFNSSLQSYRNSNIQIRVPQDEETVSRRKSVTIILLGKSGHGKSASGNTIIGHNVFTCGCTDVPTTLTLQQEVGELNDRRVTVIDTPDPSRLSSKDVHELKKLNAVMMLVIRCGTRMNKEEWAAVKRLRTVFGPGVFRERGIILLTHCDLFPLARIQKDATFLDPKLLEEFDNRVVFLTNKEENYLLQVTQIDDVMILVDDVLGKLSHLENKKGKTVSKHFLCCWSSNQSYAVSS